MRAGDARFLGALAVAVALARYGHEVVRMAVESRFIDFAYYYTYAVVAGRGLDPYAPEAVASVDRLLDIRRAAGGSNYPPLFHLLMQPLTWLPFRAAALVWLGLAQACLAGALALWLRRGPVASWAAVAAVLFVALTWQPLLENLVLGEANILLLLLVTLGWWGLGAGRPWLTAGAVALALHVKLPYAALIPVLWWTGHGGIALRAVGLAALGLLASVLAFGPAMHAHYLAYLVVLRTELYAWPINLSSWATLRRIFPHAVADALTLAVILAVVVGFARAAPRRPAPGSLALDWAWGLGLAAALLISPMLEEHYMVVLLLPVALLVRHAVDEPLPAADRGLLVASVLLVGVPYSLMRFAPFQSGPPALLPSARLLGVVVLAGLLARLCRREA